MTRTLLALLLTAALPAAAQQSLDIYDPADGAAEVEHKLVKGKYTVHFTATGTTGKPGKTTLTVPAPEKGALARGPIKTGGLIKATSKLAGDRLVITIEHGRFAMPSPDKVSNTAPNSKSLGPIVERLGRGWIGGKKGVKGKLKGMLRRSGGKRARELLVMMAQCYHGNLETVAEDARLDTRVALAKLLGVSPLPSDGGEAAAALKHAIHGYRVGGRFVPESGVGTPTRGAVRGEVGRAVLVGSVDKDADDWWRLEVPKDAKVFDMDVPAGVRFFVVRDPGDKEVLHLRLRATGKGGAYKLVVRNKRGLEHKWIELHERPATDKGSLPY